MLRLTNVAKSFGQQEIFHSVNIEVSQGQCLGLIGPNGTGKTTLLRCVSQSLKPDQGEITYKGRTEFPVHLSIESDRSLFPRLTALENIKYLLGLQGISCQRQQVTEIAEQFEFLPHLNVPAQKLSKGSKQKVQAILTVLSPHSLLILDEPTLGLDNQVEQVLIDALANKLALGHIILLSSHNVELCSQLCHQLFDLGSGKLLDVSDGELEKVYSIQLAHPLDESVSHQIETLGIPVNKNKAHLTLTSQQLAQALPILPGIESIKTTGLSMLERHEDSHEQSQNLSQSI